MNIQLVHNGIKDHMKNVSLSLLSLGRSELVSKSICVTDVHLRYHIECEYALKEIHSTIEIILKLKH